MDYAIANVLGLGLTNHISPPSERKRPKDDQHYSTVRIAEESANPKLMASAMKGSPKLAKFYRADV